MWVTNYEMVDRFDPAELDAVVLDEASILKQSDGKTRTMLIEHFADVPRRLACTATPAPNDPEELTNQAEFLGPHDAARQHARRLLRPRRRRVAAQGPRPRADVRWMASWALAIRRPSDLGYPDDGYDLPGLEIVPTCSTSTSRPRGSCSPPTSAASAAGRRSAARPSTPAASAPPSSSPPNPTSRGCCGAASTTRPTLLAELIPGAVNVHGS
jgi:hypothetical protein